MTFLHLILVVLSLAAIYTLFRKFERSLVAGGFWPVRSDPVREANPPEPVKRTRALVAGAVGAIAWGAAHLAMVSVWALTGVAVARQADKIMVAAYVVVAAAIVVVGGVMLLAEKAFGRRLVCHGLFLLVLGSFFAAVMCLILTQNMQISPRDRELAVVAAIILLVHIAIDLFLGVYLLRVGKANKA